jgi:coiled-coil domain-containing protein 6
MEKLEAEKRHLQEKLDQPVSAPMSPRNTHSSSLNNFSNNSNQINNINSNSNNIINQVSLPVGSLTNLSGSSLINSSGHHSFPASSEQAANLTEHIINLRREVSRLKANLEKTERDHKENMAKLIREEKLIKDENVSL